MGKIRKLNLILIFILLGSVFVLFQNFDLAKNLPQKPQLKNSPHIMSKLVPLSITNGSSEIEILKKISERSSQYVFDEYMKSNPQFQNSVHEFNSLFRTDLKFNNSTNSAFIQALDHEGQSGIGYNSFHYEVQCRYHLGQKDFKIKYSQKIPSLGTVLHFEHNPIQSENHLSLKWDL